MDSSSRETQTSTAHPVNPAWQFQSLVRREKEQSTFQQPSPWDAGFTRGSLSKSVARINASICSRLWRQRVHLECSDASRAEETSCQHNSSWDRRRNHRSRGGTISRLRFGRDSGEGHAYFFV